jgi:hypothetical protein
MAEYRHRHADHVNRVVAPEPVLAIPLSMDLVNFIDWCVQLFRPVMVYK